MKPVNCCLPLCTNNFRDFRNSLNKNFKLGNTRISSTHFEGAEKMNRNHPPSIFSWNKENSKRRTASRLSHGEIVKRANSEGSLNSKKFSRPEMIQVTLFSIQSLLSIILSISTCSSVEEDVDLLSHVESDH